jgi:uncharacterized damage-inducible protein DinB
MTIFDDLYDRLNEFHADILKAIDGLPVHVLDWTPGPETNSINVLVVHLTAAERFWIGDVALGEPSNRTREEEFQAHGLTIDDLTQRLSDADDYAQAAFARLAVSDLDSVRKSPRNDRTFTIGWCLLHALEHTALHTGHIQLTRQLWDHKGK